MRMLELFNDKDIDELVDIAYNRCKDKDCDACPRRNEVEEEICISDIVRDLWRKWKNAVEERDASDYVEPVVHGRWIAYEDETMICATEFVCSACRESFVSSELTDKEFYEMMKHCPNCGAKMDEVSE